MKQFVIHCNTSHSSKIKEQNKATAVNQKHEKCKFSFKIAFCYDFKYDLSVHIYNWKKNTGYKTFTLLDY